MVIPIKQDTRSIKVAVSGPEQAAYVLTLLYRLGAWRKQAGERVQEGGMVEGVSGYWVGVSKVLMPILKGEAASFDEVDSREVTVAELEHASSLQSLLDGGSNAAAEPGVGARSVGSQSSASNDGLLTQLYQLLQVARRMGLHRAAEYIESLPAAGRPQA